MPSQRHLKYFEPGILFIILGLLHAALLFSFAYGISTSTTIVTARTITRTVHVYDASSAITTRSTLFGHNQASPSSLPLQTIKFLDPENLQETIIVTCPDQCNGGAACEWVSPTNCSEYYNCDNRREPLLLACGKGLHFWDQLKQCAPPAQAKCRLNKTKKMLVGNQDL
jgi:hypothetical protein